MRPCARAPSWDEMLDELYRDYSVTGNGSGSYTFSGARAIFAGMHRAIPALLRAKGRRPLEFVCGRGSVMNEPSLAG